MRKIKNKEKEDRRDRQTDRQAVTVRVRNELTLSIRAGN